MSTTYPVALDLGSSSGRSVLGSFDGARLTIEETHRFPIRFTESGGTVTWDAMEVLAQVWRGIGRSDVVARSRGGSLASVGVDTWGVDYGLMDEAGRLLRLPRAYRDPRTARVESRFYARVSPEAGFAATGVEPALINTSMQLFADLTEDPELARQVHRVLLMPDLFNYFLCGQQATGFSIASTTGLMRAGPPSGTRACSPSSASPPRGCPPSSPNQPSLAAFPPTARKHTARPSWSWCTPVVTTLRPRSTLSRTTVGAQRSSHVARGPGSPGVHAAGRPPRAPRRCLRPRVWSTTADAGSHGPHGAGVTRSGLSTVPRRARGHDRGGDRGHPHGRWGRSEHTALPAHRRCDGSSRRGRSGRSQRDR